MDLLQVLLRQVLGAAENRWSASPSGTKTVTHHQRKPYGAALYTSTSSLHQPFDNSWATTYLGVNWFQPAGDRRVTNTHTTCWRHKKCNILAVRKWAWLFASLQKSSCPSKLKESWQIFQKNGLHGSESAVTVQLLSKSAVKVTHLY